jgi:hypothetical protein
MSSQRMHLIATNALIKLQARTLGSVHPSTRLASELKDENDQGTGTLST